MMNIRCNNCATEFENDEALIQCLVYENDNPTETQTSTTEVVSGCPICLTDQYLADIT